jgi:hypothetical protein
VTPAQELNFAISNVLSGSELDVVTDGCKEGGLVAEEKVSRESHMFIC